MASTMSKDAYNEWVDNYLTPLQNALKSSDLKSFESNIGGLQGSINNLSTYDAVSQIADLKSQWETGFASNDTTAMQSASQLATNYYDMLPSGIADQLHEMNSSQATQLLGTLPQFHTGAKTLSYGLAEFKPGELVFPPNLSDKLEQLITILGSNQISSTGGRAINLYGPLFNAEKVSLDDKLDVETVGRELGRAVSSL